jgi:hypothetical protein
MCYLARPYRCRPPKSSFFRTPTSLFGTVAAAFPSVKHKLHRHSNPGGAVRTTTPTDRLPGSGTCPGSLGPSRPRWERRFPSGRRSRPRWEPSIPQWGTVEPLVGTVHPPVGTVAPPAGTVDPQWGRSRPPAGTVDAPVVTVAPPRGNRRFPRGGRSRPPWEPSISLHTDLPPDCPPPLPATVSMRAELYLSGSMNEPKLPGSAQPDPAPEDIPQMTRMERR